MSLFSQPKPNISSQSTKLWGYQVQSSVYGKPIPIVYGTVRLAGNVIWAGDWQPLPVTSTGKGGGKAASGSGKGSAAAQQQYTYRTAIQIGLCQGQIKAILSVWQDKAQILVFQTSETFVLGGTSHTVRLQTLFFGDAGVSRADPYSVSATDFGAPGAATLAGTQQTPLLRVGSSPAAGQYTVSNGVYGFNGADTGKTLTISYSYGQQTLGSTTGQPIVDLNLALFDGGAAQTPWGHLVTAHPDQALTYPGLAYVANPSMDLGSSGVISNLSFEILSGFQVGGGIYDAHIADVLQDALTNAMYGVRGFSTADLPIDSDPYGLGSASEVRAYCSANGIFLSPVFDGTDTAASRFENLLLCGNSEAVWSEGLLKFRTYGDTTAVGNGATFSPSTAPVYDLNDDDFLSNAGEDPVMVDRPTVRDAYNVVGVEWLNRSNGYNPEPLSESDDWSVGKYGRREQSPLTMHEICDQRVAQTVCNTMLKRSVYIRSKVKFRLAAYYILLEPMDIVTIPATWIYNSPGTAPVRILTITENDRGELEIEAEEFPWSVSGPTQHPKQVASTFAPGFYADPGSVNTPIFFQPSIDLTPDSAFHLQIGLSGGANWGGAVVNMSTDGGASFNALGVVRLPAATMGVLTATLAATADPDTSGTLAVNLVESLGSLVSYTQAQADQFVSTILVDQEIIAYETATLTSSFSYNITYLRRGLFGTAVASHAIGAPVVLLNGLLFDFVFDATDVGQVRHFKFQSFNQAGQLTQDISSSAVVDYSYTIGTPTPSGVEVIHPPDVTATLDSPLTFRLSSHYTVPVFTGTITFPTLAANYDRFAQVVVFVVTDSGQFEIARYSKPRGTTQRFSGWSGDKVVLGPTTQTVALNFVAYSDDYVPGLTPFQITGITVPAAGVSALSAVDDVADRWKNLQNSVFAPKIVTVACPLYPVDISLWEDDGTGANRLHGWYTINGPISYKIGLPEGSEIIYAPPFDEAHHTLKAAVGTYAGSDSEGWRDLTAGTSPVAMASVPGLIVSAEFLVVGMAKPAANLVTTLTIAAGVGGTFPYNRLWPDGIFQDWDIPSIHWDDTLASADPNAAFSTLTVTELDSSHNPVGPESRYGTVAVGLQTDLHTRDWGDLGGQYGTTGFKYTRSGNVAYQRIRQYILSRRNVSDTAWTDSQTATLQNLNGVGYQDVLVAVGGAIPDMGTGGGPAPDAPNIVSGATSVSVVYQPYGHNWNFAFQPTIGLPTGDANYSHLKEIDVSCDELGELISTPLFHGDLGGTSVTFLSKSYPATAGTYTVRFSCINDDGNKTASPVTKVVTVQAAVVTSVSAHKRTGSEFTDDSQAIHAIVDVVPVSLRLPQDVDIWLDEADGAGFKNKLWTTLTTPGEAVPIEVFVPLDPAHTGFQVACSAILQQLDQGPTGGAAVNSFTMPAAGACSSSGVTNAQRVGSLRYVVSDSGTWTWGMTIQWQQPTMAQDPNYWFSFLTRQRGYTDGGGAWNPDPADPGDSPPGNLWVGNKVVDSGQLSGGISVAGALVQYQAPADLDIPPFFNADGTPNLYIEERLLIYSVSYRNRNAHAPLPFVLQSCWSGASSLSIFPTRQDAMVDLRNAAGHSLGGAMNKDAQGRPSVHTGRGQTVNGSNQLEAKLAGGLKFDGSDNSVADLGYTMALNASGQIALSNLPEVFGLPSLPSATYPAGAVILSQIDSKIYRNPTGLAWVKSSDPVDLAAGAIASGVTLNATQVNAGTFNGCQLILNLSNVTTTIDNHAFGGDQVGIESRNNSTGDAGLLAPTFLSIFHGDPSLLHPAASVARNGNAGIVKVYDGSGSGQVDGHGLRCTLDGSNGNISSNGAFNAVGGAAFYSVLNAFGIVAASVAQNGSAGIVKAFDGTGSGSLGSGLRCVMDGNNGHITSTGGLWDANGNQVVSIRQVGPGNPVGWADATAMNWAQWIYNILRAHGLST